MSAEPGGAPAAGVVGSASLTGRSKERDIRIDALRALAITLVVAGHAALISETSLTTSVGAVVFGALPGGATLYIGPDSFRAIVPNLIYVFHMPLFAFLSGYVLQGREGPGPARLIGRRFTSLMVPYLAWAIVAYVYLGASGSLPKFVWSAILDPGSPGGLWYLYALFGCFVFFAALRWLPGWRWLMPASAVALVVAVVRVPYSTFLGQGYVAWVLPFFIGGYFAAGWAGVLQAHRRAGVLMSALIATLSVPIAWPVLGGLPRWWSGAVTDYFMAHPGARGEYVISILGGPVARYVSAAAVVMLCYYLWGLLPERFQVAQQALGRRSLGVYAIHGFVLYGLYWLGVRWWPLSAAGALAGAFALAWLLEGNDVTARLFLGQRIRRRPVEEHGR